MSKVYMVVGSCGSWDDYNWFIVGIFTDIAQAEKAKEKFISDIQIKLSEVPCPISDEDRKKLDEYENLPDNWEELDRAYSRWKYVDTGNLLKYNMDSFKIEEVELNATIEHI
jgi:hypothetical protein